MPTAPFAPRHVVSRSFVGILLGFSGVAAAGAQEVPPPPEQVEAREDPESDPPGAEIELQEPGEAKDGPAINGRPRRRTTRRPYGTDEEYYPFFIEGGIGYARFDYDTLQSNFDSGSDGVASRINFEWLPERHLGLGVLLETVSTTDDLFVGKQINSGVRDEPANADAFASDLFTYFSGAPIANDWLKLPLHVGPFISTLQVDYLDANVEFDYATFGIRAGVRPEIKLVNTARFDWSIYGGASYGIGVTVIDEDRIGRDETYESDTQTFRAEGGLRFAFGQLNVGVAYVFSGANTARSDPENGLRVPEIDYDSDLFMLTIGGRF
jgi:hypothetical protein